MVRHREIYQELLSIGSFSDDEMSEESLMGHLVIDGKSGCFTEILDILEYRVRLGRDECAIIYVYDLAEFSLFMESYTPVGKDNIGT